MNKVEARIEGHTYIDEKLQHYANFLNIQPTCSLMLRLQPFPPAALCLGRVRMLPSLHVGPR